MIIDLFQIGEHEKDFAFELQPDEIELDEDTARLKKAVNIAGKVKKQIAQFDVSGEIYQYNSAFRTIFCGNFGANLFDKLFDVLPDFEQREFSKARVFQKPRGFTNGICARFSPE